MRSQEIARRYASALYQVADEDSQVKAIEAELSAVAVGTSEGADVRLFLAHPLVPRDVKSAFLAEAFPDTSERMRNFLELLIRNQRETYLDLIHEEFVNIRTEAEGMIQVTVTTAQSLSEDDTSRLRARLERALASPVQLTELVDNALLGGARIEAAGHVLDGTLRARLSELRRQLEE